MENKLKVKSRKELRQWFIKNAKTSDHCWVKIDKSTPTNTKDLNYINVVEEALCFGWIDSIHKGGYCRLSPRRKTGHWTQLNIFRCKRLIKLGLMTSAGKAVMPKDTSFKINADLKKLLSKDKQLAKKFYSFPKLYQIIRLDAIVRYEKTLPDTYKKAKANFIKQTKAGKMYGNWNDYGRLK